MSTPGSTVGISRITVTEQRLRGKAQVNPILRSCMSLAFTLCFSSLILYLLSITLDEPLKLGEVITNPYSWLLEIGALLLWPVVLEDIVIPPKVRQERMKRKNCH